MWRLSRIPASISSGPFWPIAAGGRAAANREHTPSVVVLRPEADFSKNRKFARIRNRDHLDAAEHDKRRIARASDKRFQAGYRSSRAGRSAVLFSRARRLAPLINHAHSPCPVRPEWPCHAYQALCFIRQQQQRFRTALFGPIDFKANHRGGDRNVCRTKSAGLSRS